MEAPQPYTACKLTLSLPLSPAWSGHELEGARAALDDMLLKYNADIGAVLIAYGKLAFASDETAEPEDGGGAYLRTHTAGPVAVGRIFDEHPVVHVRVSMEALLFTPRLGELLTGRVNIVGPGHVACLVAGLFNAAVLGDDLAGGYDYDDADGTPKWQASSAHAAAKAGAEEAAAAGSSASSAAAAADVGKKRKRAEATAAAAAAAGAGVTYNRILALNPEVLTPGTEVTFRLKSLSHAGGIISMHGSFIDPALGPASTASSSSSSGAAGGAGAGAGAGSSSSSSDGPRAVPTPTSKAAASAAAGKSGKKSAVKPPEAKRWRADDDDAEAAASSGAGASSSSAAAAEPEADDGAEEAAAPAPAVAASAKKDKKEKKDKAEKSAKKDKSRA